MQADRFTDNVFHKPLLDQTRTPATLPPDGNPRGGGAFFVAASVKTIRQTRIVMDNRFPLAKWTPDLPVQMKAIDNRDLYRLDPHPPIKDYSSAVAAAIAWLGNRYLLAQPVNVIRR
jgi:hypothetical protein